MFPDPKQSDKAILYKSRVKSGFSCKNKSAYPVLSAVAKLRSFNEVSVRLKLLTIACCVHSKEFYQEFI